MERCLKPNEIEYVLFHLKQHVELSDEISEGFAFGMTDGAIVFPLSDQDMSPVDVELGSEVIPLLFPLSDDKKSFAIDGGRLIFQHDFLKSAFYLLSAYQEVHAPKTDAMGRFRFEGSVHQRYGFTGRPLVNYYFEIIIQGLQEWGRHNGVEVKRRRLFRDFGFMLTHDVDRIDYYHWRETVFKWLQLTGMKKRHYSRKRLFRAAVDAVLPTVFPGFKADPWWNFKVLQQQEKDLGVRSVWFFLNRDGSAHDARYHLEEKRIKNLMAYLQDEGCEIGLHGSLKTAGDKASMVKALNRVSEAAGSVVMGTRQHFLKFSYPSTLKIQQAAGLAYDTTMGFAEHEGFRNGYCYPFRPFDHEKGEMMTIWELPLALMDTTLFGYRLLKYNEMKLSVNALIKEVSRFGGLFVMLWHNCNFDEYQYPGIQVLYKELLTQIADARPQSVTGAEVLGMVDDQ